VRDQDEQQRIREHFETEPGKGHQAEEAYGELENARDQGNDSTMLRAEAKLAALGYPTREQRADAAAARRAHAEATAREEARIKENRGAAAARDDHEGGPVEQKSGVTSGDGNPAGQGETGQRETGAVAAAKAKARKTPPAGRRTPGDKQEKG
jgi:hypothetical protein